MREKLSLINSFCSLIASWSLSNALAHAATIGAPTNASAVSYSENRINLSWQDRSTNENGFEIVRSSTGPYGTFFLIGSTNANVAGYNDTALNASTHYCYKVRAFKRMDGKTAYSDFSSSACATTLAPPAPQPPTAPSNAQDLAVSYNRIDVYWQDNSSNESGFEVYRSDGTGGVFARITTTASGATYFADTGLNSSAQYCHKIRAFTTSGGLTAFSAFSNMTCTTTPAPPEPPVVRLTAATTGTDIDADGYYVDLWLMCNWMWPNCRQYQTRGYVAANGTVSFSNRYPGDYELEISGIAGNCDFSGPNPVKATMTATASGEASFSAACRSAKKIAFVKQVEESSAIFVMDSNVKQSVQLTLPSDRALEPAWSPDGSKIAFRSDRDATSQIYVMNADGLNQVRLTDTGGNFRPVWSPDGSKIAFTSNRDGNNEIYVVNADGSGLVNLTNHLADDGDPAWSPDGKKIAFRSNRDDDGTLSAIYMMNADGSGVTRLWGPGTEAAQPAWSPDGALVAYSAVWCSYSCVRLILLVSIADGSLQNLTLPSQTSMLEGTLQWPTMECESHSDPAWYPDGRKLTFTISGDCFGGRSVIFWRLYGPQQYEGQTDRWLWEWMTSGFNSNWQH